LLAVVLPFTSSITSNLLRESADNIVQMITKEISLIEKYRTVLIANAVTGKIKI
jgi:hypothetical protein